MTDARTAMKQRVQARSTSVKTYARIAGIRPWSRSSPVDLVRLTYHRDSLFPATPLQQRETSLPFTHCSDWGSRPIS